MASNVKAWTVSVEHFPLRLIVTIGSLNPAFRPPEQAQGNHAHGPRYPLRPQGTLPALGPPSGSPGHRFGKEDRGKRSQVIDVPFTNRGVHIPISPSEAGHGAA